MDYFLFNGEITRGSDLEFIEFVARENKSPNVTLLLVTPGGSPDAAYKMGRYLQAKYESISILIPGFCKSAGTLLAIAGSDLIFTAYGELGPLDIQMVKTDHLAGLDSGLNISEAFLTLEERAREQFHKLVVEIISGSGGVVSFQTASHSAAEIVSSMYGPIFGKMDPEEVGSRARAMRIGEDYAVRLNRKFENLKGAGIAMLSRTYSSHGFVIDREEALAIFKNVREATDDEKAVIDDLGLICRHPGPSRCIQNISDKFSVNSEKQDGATNDVEAEADDRSPEERDGFSKARKRTNGPDGGNSVGAAQA